MKIYHLDLKVTMYRKDYLKKWFKKMKENGFDGVVAEIDNKLVFPSHPDFAAPDALPADEWTELVRFGKEIGLTVYPLLQTLGHISVSGVFSQMSICGAVPEYVLHMPECLKQRVNSKP
jgi:hypothetical protein